MANQTVAGLLVSIDGNTVRLRNEIDKAQSKVKEFGRETRKEMQQAKGSIALVGEEIGIHLNRHLRSFVTQLPGVAPAMAAAFNVAAVVGLGVAAFETGKKVYEFFEKSKKAAETARQETQKFMEAFQRSNLELAVTNDKLEDATAKLEKRPGNGLKTALDEARLAAFQLQKQLQDDIEATQKLMSQQGATFMQRMVFGSAGNDGTLAQVGEYQKQVARINEEQTLKLTAAKTVDQQQKIEQEGAERLGKLQENYVGKLDEEIKARERMVELQKNLASEYEKTGVGGGGSYPEYQRLNKRFAGSDGEAGDQTQVLNSLKTFHNSMLAEQVRSGLTLQNMQDQVSLKTAQATAEELERRKQAAERAREAERKAQEAQMKGFEQDLAGEREQHAVSIEEEHSFWLKKLDATRYGSTNYQAILIKLGQENQEIIKANAEATRKQSEFEASIERQDDERYEKETREKERMIEKRLGLALEKQKSARQSAGETYQGVSEDTQTAVESGEMTPRERLAALKQALQAQTAAKQESFEQDMRLQSEALDATKKLYGEASNEYQQQLEDGTKRLEETLDERNKMQAESSREMASLQRQTMEIGWQGALNDTMRRGEDFEAQIKDFMESSLNTVNDMFGKMMSGQYRRGDWTRTGQQVFQGIGKTALQDGEGALLKGIGLKGGKLGTRSNPMFVRSADQIPQMPKMPTSGLTAGLGGAGTQGGGLGGFGGFLTTALGLIPMASGGPMYPGNYLVGEEGPEIMRVGSPGYIHNNTQTRAMMGSRSGGGDTHHHHSYSIDARGAHDPEAVDRAVQRGIRAAAPQIIAGSLAVQKDMRGRKPSTGGM